MTDRRRAIIKVSQQDFERMIVLPKGYRILGIRDDWTRNGVAVLVESDELEPVPDAVELPQLFGQWSAEGWPLRWVRGL